MAGETVRAAAGVARTVRVESAGARWLASTEVVSAARYDEFGRALTLPTGEWATEEDAATVSAIAAANRIAVLGPPGRLP